jgi:pimeloyl-ACP methyl ester carboxylesterase
MYYEIHGSGGPAPLVLLHGAFSAIGTSFGAVLPGLAQGRTVIGVDLQAHGRTADIDRPINIEQMADDIAALLQYLKIDKADVLGYSMGAGVALQFAIRHADMLRKVILVSLAYNSSGFYPGFTEGMSGMKVEMMEGSPWQQEYAQIAPKPENWPVLFEKVVAFNSSFEGLPDEQIKALEAPMLIIAGDSDIVQPEHVVAMFRLLGGGVIGDMMGMPKSQLAILPGTPHSRIMERANWLVPMIGEFLGAGIAL